VLAVLAGVERAARGAPVDGISVPSMTTYAPSHRGVRDQLVSPAMVRRESFRMSKRYLEARPIYRRKRKSIDSRLSTVLAALAVTRFIETRTDWSIEQFVCTSTATGPSRSAPASRNPPCHPTCATSSRSSDDQAHNLDLPESPP
jgi:hypothetical protein